jgi:hypothetical protein
MFENCLKIQLPITYIGNKYLNNSGSPYLTKEDPYKMPYNPYLMNRLKSDYYSKLKKNNPTLYIKINTEFLK